MKAFVTYLKKESPAMQLASGSTGWIELPNGQRWNPATYIIYCASTVPPLVASPDGIVPGRYGH